MIKVLYLINHAGKAGTERYVLSLIERLHDKKIQAYFAYNEGGLLVDEIKDFGIIPFQIKMRKPWDIIAARKLKKYCEKNGIEIIHTQFMRENYIAMLAKLLGGKFQVFYTNHFIMDESKFLSLGNRIFNSFQDKIIAVCNKGKEMMIVNKMDERKINVIFNGVDTQEWSEPIRSSLRDEFNISQHEFVFLCASRFAHDKGHKYLIRGIKKLKEISKKKFTCVLANDGPLLEECKVLVRDLELDDCVIFTGFRKDVKNLIWGSDLYINSSSHEALSFAIIEVLACGIPVIATNMAGNGDIINENTQCGILVEYDNEELLAQEIFKIMKDETKREELKKNAKKTAQEIFNLDIMVEKTYNLYVGGKK
jgi:glycosyltransferase involved in cell wall biosynthesis